MTLNPGPEAILSLMASTNGDLRVDPLSIRLFGPPGYSRSAAASNMMAQEARLAAFQFHFHLGTAVYRANLNYEGTLRLDKVVNEGSIKGHKATVKDQPELTPVTLDHPSIAPIKLRKNIYWYQMNWGPKLEKMYPTTEGLHANIRRHRHAMAVGILHDLLVWMEPKLAADVDMSGAELEKFLHFVVDLAATDMPALAFNIVLGPGYHLTDIVPPGKLSVERAERAKRIFEILNVTAYQRCLSGTSISIEATEITIDAQKHSGETNMRLINEWMFGTKLPLRVRELLMELAKPA